MKLKQYLLMGAGVLIGGAISIAGVSYATSSNSSNNLNLITSEKAKSIMLAKVPGATILEFSYDNDDKVPKYDGTLIKDNFEYEVDVNAKNGTVIKFEKENISISNNKEPNSNNSNVGKPSTGDSQTTNNGSSVNKPSTGDNQSSDNGSSANKPSNNGSGANKPSTGGSQSSNNGSSVNKPSNNSLIGESKAKSIMLAKVPGATITSFYLENDSTPEYEGKLVSGSFEYEISVNAKTGAINEFSKETIEKYDDDKYDNDNDHDDDRYDNDNDYDDDHDDRYDNDNDHDDDYDDDRYDNDHDYDDDYDND